MEHPVVYSFSLYQMNGNVLSQTAGSPESLLGS